MKISCIPEMSLIYSRTFSVSCKQSLTCLLLRAYTNEVKITLSMESPAWLPILHLSMPLFLWIYLVWFTKFLYAWILLADRLRSSAIHSHWRLLIKLMEFYSLCSKCFWAMWTGLLRLVCADVELCSGSVVQNAVDFSCWAWWPLYMKCGIKLLYEYI